MKIRHDDHSVDVCDESGKLIAHFSRGGAWVRYHDPAEGVYIYTHTGQTDWGSWEMFEENLRMIWNVDLNAAQIPAMAWIEDGRWLAYTWANAKLLLEAR